MTSSFNFQDILKWSLKKSELTAWEAEVKKGRETFKIRLDAQNDDASLSVFVQKNWLGKFFDLFKKKKNLNLSQKKCLLSKTFENINVVKFTEEKKRLEDLIKRKTSVDEILATIAHNFHEKSTASSEPSHADLNDVNLEPSLNLPIENRVDVPLLQDVIDIESNDEELKAKIEEDRIQSELQAKIKGFEEEIENLESEIEEAQKSFKTNFCIETAAKIQGLALTKIEELKTNLESLKPQIETIKLEDSIATLNSNIHEFQDALMQKMICDINLKANQANVDIANCSDHIRENFEKGWARLELELEPILSIDNAKKKETELCRLIDIITEEQKNELLEKILRGKEGISEKLNEPLYDLLTPKDFLNSINELRVLSALQRQRAWQRIEYDIQNKPNFLSDLEILKQRIEIESQADQIVAEVLSKAPRGNSYKALALDTAWLVTSFAGNFVMDMFKSFKTVEPVSVSQFFRLNDAITSYLKHSSIKLKDDELKVLLNVFSFCHYNKKIEAVNGVEEELKNLFQAGMCTSILSRSQSILEALRLNFDAPETTDSFISNIKKEEKSTKARFHDLQVLETSAFLYDQYRNLIKEKRREVENLTGNEMQQAKDSIQDLEGKLTQELEWLSGQDQITTGLVETVKYKLHDIETIIDGIFKIEEQKKIVRKEIDECIAEFDELNIIYQGKLDEIESQYGVDLESSRHEINAAKEALHGCKLDNFLELNLKDLIAVQRSVYTKAKSGMHTLQVTSLIDDLYKAVNDLQIKEEESNAVKNELKISIGSRQAQLFNASFIDKKLKKIEQEKQENLKNHQLKAKEMICLLKVYTDQVGSAISHAKKMQILSFQEQIKKFETRQEAIQKELNKEPGPISETVDELEAESLEIKVHLLNAKKMLIKSLEMKMQDHRKAMSEVTRPLRMSGEIYIRAQALINETEIKALEKISVIPLKEHLEKVLNFARFGSFQQEGLEEDVINQIRAEDFKKSESAIETMIEVNTKHASLIRESALAAEKAKMAFHQVREKTSAMIEELSENDQFVEKGILENVLKDVEKEVEKLSDYDPENSKDSSFWDTSAWSMTALWNKAAYEVTRATEKQKISYGESSAKLLKAIDRAKAAPTLSIPDQLLDLSYILPEKRKEIETEMRNSFSRKMKDTLRQAENVIENYETSFNDILGRFYIPRNGRFRKDIEEFIKLKQVELSSLKKEYSNTFWWVPRRAFEYFNFVKMTENIAEMSPSVMRTYEKDVTTFSKNIKASLEKSFPIVTVAKAHKNFENAYLKAKSEAVFYRSNSQFLHAYKVEKQAIHINEVFKKDWDRPKVTSIADLRALNGELIKCGNSIDRGISSIKSEARTPMPLSVQLEKLNQESPESREAYEALKANIEALKEDAIEIIKKKIKDHRDDLVNASCDFKEIAEKFNLPSQWTAKIDEAINRELDTYSEDYSVSRFIFFTKNVEDFSASEAALNATKITKDCNESLKRAYQPKGIGVDVELKGLRDNYKKYRAVITKIEGTRDNLIRQGQYLYVSKLDTDIKKAEDAFKALDENLPPNERLIEIKDALSYRTRVLHDAERIANTSKILTAKEQVSQLPKNFAYHEELQVYRADQIKIKTEKQRDELTKQIESIENIPFLPSDWKQVIAKGLKDCKNQLTRIDEGILEEGYFGSKTLKPLDEINSEDSTIIENQLERIDRELQDIDRLYGIKDLISHEQARSKLLLEAEDLKIKLSISQALDIEALVTKVKIPLINCIQPVGTHAEMVVRIREFVDTLRLQNTALSSGLKKIQGDRPSSGAARLLNLDPGSAEYIKCKKGLQEFTAQQLLNLNKAIDQYDQRIDEIEKKLQGVTSAETVLSESWKRDAYSFIRKRKDYVVKLQEGLPHIHADGSLKVKPFNSLSREELVHYEKIVMLYVGAQTTFVQEKDKNSDEYTKSSALFILESALHLVDLEKTANSLSLQVNRLKANATQSERANQDKNKSIVLNAGKEVFKKLIEFTAGNITRVGHTQTMRDVLELALASMTRMNLEFSSSDRGGFAELTQDPWVTLYLYDKGEGHGAVNAKAELYVNGFKVLYKTFFSDATRGNGWEEKVHFSLTPEQAKQCAKEAVLELHIAAQENEDRKDPQHPKVIWLNRISDKCDLLNKKLSKIKTEMPDVGNRNLFQQFLDLRTQILKEIDEVFEGVIEMKIEAMEGMGMAAEDELFKKKQTGGGLTYKDEHKHDGPPDSQSTSTSSTSSSTSSSSSTSTSTSTSTSSSSSGSGSGSTPSSTPILSVNDVEEVD